MPLPSFSRPTGFAGWASGASGAARVTEPSATEKALGWQIGTSGSAGFNGGVPPSSYFNWKWNTDYAWQKYLDDVRGAAFVGDGSDGDLILVNQTFVATRAMQIRDLALGFSGVFKPNGFPHGVHLLTGVSGVIDAAGGRGGTGVSGGALFYPTGALASAGPLRGSTGLAQGDGGASLFPNTLGARGATGGRGSQAFTPIAPRNVGAPTGVWRDRVPDGTARWLTDGGHTHAVLKGGGPGAPGTGDGSFNIAARGGNGGDLLLAMVGEVNWQGTIDVRGGDGGAGFRGGTLAESGGPGGGGGGGAAVLGIGRRTRFDVRYVASGGFGGAYAQPGTGVTGGIGQAGPPLLEIPLP